MTFGPHLRMGAGWQWSQPYDYRAGTFSPTVDLQGEERDWRLNQSRLANDLINHDFVKKPP